jgi:hypothetical protein
MESGVALRLPPQSTERIALRCPGTSGGYFTFTVTLFFCRRVPSS